MWPEEHKGDFLPPIKYLPIFGTYAGYKKSKPTKGCIPFVEIERHKNFGINITLQRNYFFI